MYKFIIACVVKYVKWRFKQGGENFVKTSMIGYTKARSAETRLFAVEDSKQLLENPILKGLSQMDKPKGDSPFA